MTALTTAISPAPVIDERQTFGDILHAEWTKLRTIRSTGWNLGTVLAGVIAVGMIVCAATAANWGTMTAADRAGFDPTFGSLKGLYVGELAVGVLGALVITSEYATGMIRSTLAAMPGRRAVLAAKGVTMAAVVFVVSTLASFVAFFCGQAILAGKAGISITDHGALRAVIGGGLFLTVLSLFALGIGAIFRHTAGAISAFVGAVLVLPAIVSPLPNPWGRDITKFLPSDAGQAIFDVHANGGTLAPWTGFAVLCGWAVAALGLAAWLINRRDA